MSVSPDNSAFAGSLSDEATKIRSSMLNPGQGFNFVFDIESAWSSDFYNSKESEAEVTTDVFCPNYSSQPDICF